MRRHRKLFQLNGSAGNLFENLCMPFSSEALTDDGERVDEGRLYRHVRNGTGSRDVPVWQVPDAVYRLFHCTSLKIEF
jgi:hypothetical protein